MMEMRDLVDVGARLYRLIDELTVPIHFYHKEWLRSWAGRRRYDRVLDLGSGMSPHRRLFRFRAFVSIDIEMDHKPSVQADACRIPFRDSVFDAILCTALLEHVDDPDAVLRECERTLAPEGVFFLSVPFLFGEHGLDFRRWTRHGLRLWLESSGFRILDFRELGGIFTVLAVTLVRTLSEVLPPSLDRHNWSSSRNWPRYIAHLAFQVLLAPLTWLLRILDRLDGQRNFTCGYAVTACKKSVQYPK